MSWTPSPVPEPVGAEPAPAVVMRGIVKRYATGTVANRGVGLRVNAGEIHALVGENGAGKSTLMSILYGLEHRDEGEIALFGQPVSFRSPVDAIAAGLGMVHQNFKLVPSFTVAENVVLGHEPTRRTLIDRRRTFATVRELSDRFGLRVEPGARLAEASVGVRQRVEILKALYRRARVLILDEPTAVLTPQETDDLFDVLRGLAAGGMTIIIVTHKLQEVMAISASITVLRDGCNAATMRTADTTAAEIARAMTARNIDVEEVHRPGEPAGIVLAVEGLAVHRSGRAVVDKVSLTVRAGEIVGIAGVAGNGQEELIEAITGVGLQSKGTVSVNGSDVSGSSVHAHRAAGVAYIPEDRHEVGAAAGATLRENAVMGFHGRPPLCGRLKLLDTTAMKAHTQRLLHDYDVKAESESVHADSLSGGNLQKLIVGREMMHGASLLVAQQPTRGLDIGSVQHIHQKIRDYRDAGHAVLLVSSELQEILTLSDHVLVMYGGRIVASWPRDQATLQQLGLAMAGHAQPMGDS